MSKEALQGWKFPGDEVKEAVREVMDKQMPRSWTQCGRPVPC